MLAGAVSCRSSSSQWNEDDGGTTRWIDVPAGRVKTRVYTRASASPLPGRDGGPSHHHGG